MDKFVVIAITTPFFYESEAEKINEILSSGQAHFVHLRKPDSKKEDMEELINRIDPKFHHKLKIHDHFDLVDKYDVGGIHLNSRNPLPVKNAKSISISIHTLQDIEKTDFYDYFFISPVYDSISKKGYNAAFDLRELSQRIQNKNAIALGGVVPQKFDELKDLGFLGAAMLGYFFDIDIR